MTQSGKPRRAAKRSRSQFWLSIVAAVAAGAGACLPAVAQIDKRAGAIDDPLLAHAAQQPQDWVTPGGSWQEQNYSGLRQIDVDTVARLKPAWSFDFDTSRKQEAAAVVVDGVMYVSTAWSKVYALDAKSGRQLWLFDPHVPGHVGVRACCDVVNRGVAVYRGKVIVATLDGRLIALDYRTGKPVWSTATVPPDGEYTISGAPRVFHDKVVIGNAGSDFGVRGFLSAYDIKTGKLVWKFYLTPRDPKLGPEHAASDSVQAMMASTWAGRWYEHGGGASPWNAITYDPDFNRIYVGTGNGSPSNPFIRSEGTGANLFTASIVALDADTGKYAWHYQENPLEGWDYDAAAPFMLATLALEGRPRKVLLHLPKNGFFYVIDRETGKLLSADKTRPEINWADHVDLGTGLPAEAPGIRYSTAPFTIYPGSNGVHNWDPWAFSPNTGLVYFASEMEGATYEIAPRTMTFYQDGPNNNGAPHKLPVGSPSYPSYLAAWDPVARREVWRANVKGTGVMATAGNLVFQGGGTYTGDFWAVRADTGEKVWSAHTPNRITSSPVSYAVDDVQYVAVLGGSGSGPILDERVIQPGRVFAFKLDGTARLPDDPPKASPAAPPEETFTQVQIDHGRYLARGVAIGGFCGRCHAITGPGGSNNLPDLRRTPLLNSKEAWRTVVLDGALEHYGMIAWKKLLTPDDVDDIRAFAVDEARKLAVLERGAKADLGGSATPGRE